MAHMALPTPYYDDHEQLLQAFNDRFNAWNPIPQTPMHTQPRPQFGFPGAEQFAAAITQHAMQFKMPSPPVSPSLPGSSYSIDMSPNGFVSMASVMPPRNDTVFGWNSVSVSQAETLDVGHKPAEPTLSAVLRSRSCLKRPASPSPTPSLSSSTSSTSPAPMQPEVATAVSSAAAAAAAPKRARTQISSKDFVPPDVTGLSKREARLVKNRAAAFLSRQRKREEFEELEKHCQELERDVARLKAGQSQSPSKKLKSDECEPSQDVLAELAQLRESNAQLAAQNAQLSAQNAQLAAENARLTQREVCPKVEDEESSLLLSEPTGRREKESKEKHGTGSVALMVLMISLSLLGKPLASGMSNARAKAPMSLHTPSAPQPSSTFDYVLPRTNTDYEWLTSPTDLDHDDFSSIPPVSLSTSPQSPATRTLTVQGLETLDIPTDIRDFNFSMDVDERDARNVVLAVSNANSQSSSSSSSGMSTLSSPSSASISTLDSVWPEPSVDSTMTMLGGDYMSYDYDSDIFAPVSTAPKQSPPIPGTRRMTVAVVPPSQDGSGRWSVEVKESL
ncbi:unnamed protein product [Rhizoctonia solani]|uniref:BZIP domain-containing protein n=1 Tax=Rhizoctonia solani TaxID=456999 RepID=A0A8H3BA58_9AGAM|nr:unnamed protein product [Rhizoctonia solani]